MKISKLFHWLYAILMFLPILVFVPNAFYYGFNETAVAQEKTELVPVYYESNEVNTLDDLVIGRVYRFNFDTVIPTSTEEYILCSEMWIVGDNSSVNNYNMTNPPYIGLYTGDTNIYYNVNSPSNPTLKRKLSSGYIDFVLRGKGNFTTNIQLISYCPTVYATGETTPVTTNMSITDSMSYAWNSTWHNDLFSWSYDSFLTQPFLYITNLFNVPATNTLLYCLSYWLNISIIWLCFDVVIYVPLLVHRWLDKGIVE